MKKFNRKRFIFLAKLGIVESTDKNGNYQVQKIDDPSSFAQENELSFYPDELISDEEARLKLNSLTHNQLMKLE